MDRTIGFVGLGNMGAPMVRALAKAGYRLTAFDIDEDRRRSLQDTDGVRTIAEPADIAANATVILMLPNGKIVRDFLVGPRGIAGDLREDSLVIDMSSSDPGDYGDLETTLAVRSIDFIDAPVSGNVSGAEAGTLTIMAGGTDRAFERAEPILGAMGKTIFHTGPLGSGQVMKALNNLSSAAGLIVAIEVLLVARKAGLAPQLVVDILNVSTGRNNATERKIGPFVLSGAYNSGFGLSLMAKDLRTAASVADRLGVKMPLAQNAVSIANTADEALGHGADHTAVAKWLEQEMGVCLG